MNAPAGYIVASHVAIWAIGRTPEAALAEYVSTTGDDSITIENISRDPRGGTTYLMPATARLLAKVEQYGGAISWSDDGKTADV